MSEYLKDFSQPRDVSDNDFTVLRLSTSSTCRNQILYLFYYFVGIAAFLTSEPFSH